MIRASSSPSSYRPALLTALGTPAPGIPNAPGSGSFTSLSGKPKATSKATHEDLQKEFVEARPLKRQRRQRRDLPPFILEGPVASFVCPPG
jgi:hypothetical protein